MNDDVIIVGSLNDKELRKSIDELVNYVDMRTSDMASSFVVSMDMMKGAMKDFAVTQKVSVDVMKEAWRNMSSSFDAMVAAQSTATSGCGGRKPNVEESTIGWLREQSRLQSQIVDQQKIGTAEKQKEVDKHAAINSQLKEELKSTKQIQQETAKRTLKNVLSLPQNELKEAEYRLKVLLNTAAAYKTRKAGILSEEQWHRLNNAIAKTRQQIDKLQEKKPRTLDEVIGIDAKSLDEITAKMRALKRVQIDPKNTEQVEKLRKAYQDLKKQQAELMGLGIQQTHANNYLAQSFGYIRNRLVYAMTLGAATNFVKQVYEIRSQYELLERSLGVLVNSFQRGSQIFQELNDMALKSPFTLIELATAAKQLTAYNFTANEVVNTTRRLADISAALGVPMERLTYNLGQIRAQTVLTARDARDFANAGLPIVKSLAEYYSTLEKRVVSTGDVYDRMSKKMVSYNDVVAVLNKMTDEGGKFFDFQAKQAETLRVQLNNLTLAWNNMLNEMGEANQGLLNLPVKGLKLLLQNWKSLDNIIWDVISLLGTFKAMQVIYALHANKIGVVNMQMKSMYMSGQKVIDVFKRIGTGIIDAFKNKYNWITLAAVALMDLGWSAWEAHKAIVALYDTLRENANESMGSIEKFTNTYKDLKNILNTLSQSDIAKKISPEDSQKAWRAMKEEIDSSVSSSTSLIAKLENINDINIRLKTGFDYLDKIKSVDASIQSMKTGVISINQDWAKWWNAWLAPEGLTQNVRDYVNAVKEGASSTYAAWEQMVRDLKPTIKDMFVYANTEGFDVTQQREFFERVLKDIAHQEKMSVDEYRTMRIQAEQEYANFAIGSAKSEFEQRRALQETFFTWINERHSSELSSERIKELQQGTFLTGENAKWAKQRAQEFSKQYGTSFNDLWGFVQRANTWSIYIPVFVGNADEQAKSFYDQLTEADKNANAAYSKIQRLQQRITELRTKGGDVSGLSKELSQAQQDLRDAEAAGGHASKQTKLNAKVQKDAVSDVSQALREEIQLIKEMRSNYDKLHKSGINDIDALKLSTQGYELTLERVNNVLQKFGINKFNASDFAGKNVRQLFDSLTKQRDTLIASGKVKTSSLKDLDVEIQKLTVDAKAYDMKKITDGLNNELGKLKDEYELAIELDANPELGNMFADMFGITPDMLSKMPHTVGQLVDKYQDEIDKQLKGKFSTPFNVLKTDINKWAKAANVDPQSELIKTLSSKQNEARELVKKTYLDIQKMVDDYIVEYGDQQQQIEKIEKEKNNALLQLNSIYNTEALRQTKQYLDAKEAIENAARIKEAKATFAALKKTTDYDRFFNAIDTLTSEDALAIKAKIKQGIIQAFKDGGLTVSEFRREIKSLESQFDKLTESSSLWTNYLSGGFDKLIQKAKETGQEIETIGESISVKGTIDDKDKNFLQSMGNIFSDGNGGSMDFTSLMNKFGGNMKGLGEAVSQAGQGMQQGAGGFASAIAIIDMVIKNVHQTVQAIGSVIDELDSVRNEENKLTNAYWEGFKKSDSYAASGWENLKSGNIAGAVSDTANSLISLFNVLENAKNEKINAQIKESERNVKSLENSYKNLQRAIENAYGAQQIGARKAAIANKELQLVELQRQLALENSRSSKNRDVERITDLQGQIIDLKNELKDMRNDITNSFLGISSVSDAVNTMMDDIVDALRNGEDAMKSFDENIDNMIANMIKQVFSARILGPMIERIWQNIDNELQARGQGWEAWLLALQTELGNVMTNTGDKGYGYHFFKDKNGGWTYTDNKWRAAAWEASGDFQRITYEEWKAMMEGYINQAQKALEDATTPQMDDIRRYAGDLRGVSPELEGYIGELENILREMGLIKDATSEQALSKLQQGISGITEDTAGAIEAYMNSVSQQVYLQSDILTQIRDTILGFELDIQVATMSQMLWQLQQSYIVQQNIESLLQNVINPSGRAFMVELAS